MLSRLWSNTNTEAMLNYLSAVWWPIRLQEKNLVVEWDLSHWVQSSGRWGQQAPLDHPMIKNIYRGSQRAEWVDLREHWQAISPQMPRAAYLCYKSKKSQYQCHPGQIRFRSYLIFHSVGFYVACMKFSFCFFICLFVICGHSL